MSEATQTIIVATVVGVLMAYSAYRAYKTLTHKRQDDRKGCSTGCEGCPLQAKQQNGCEKRNLL